MKTITKFLPYIIILLLLFFIFGQSFFKHDNNQEKVKVDTIYKVITIEPKVGSFANNKPKPIYIEKNNDAYIEKLYNELANLQDDNQKKDYLLKQLSTKVYTKEYDDDVVKIVVTDTINGILQNQNVGYVVKKQEIQVNEIHTTKMLKPKFTISAGLGVASKIDLDATPTAIFLVGFKNKKGNEFLVGYTSDKTVILTLKKDIFTKF